MLTIAFRNFYLLRWSSASNRLPGTATRQIAKIFTSGSGIFIVGFLIWNLDNIFCDSVTGWKRAMGWPAAFALEGLSMNDAMLATHSRILQVIHGGT